MKGRTIVALGALAVLAYDVGAYSTFQAHDQDLRMQQQDARLEEHSLVRHDTSEEFVGQNVSDEWAGGNGLMDVAPPSRAERMWKARQAQDTARDERKAAKKRFESQALVLDHVLKLFE